MVLYFYKGDIQKFTKANNYKQASKGLARACVKDYLGKDKTLSEVKTGAHGKPYYPDTDIDFNVSHSDDFWACIVSSEKIGLDVQRKKNVAYEKLAGRFFTSQEAGYVARNGLDSFFDIWIRKEAYVKFLGTGFAASGGFKNFSVLDDTGQLAEQIGFDEEKASVITTDIGTDIKCAICTGIGSSEKTLEKKPIETYTWAGEETND